MSFSTLGLADALLRAVTEQGYTEPTPIQAQAIPAVLAGRDLLAGAQTGTGKTAAFVLPMLQRLSTRPAPATRARQAADPRADPHPDPRARRADRGERPHLRQVPAHRARRSIYGGVGIDPQIAQLRRGVEILVATPGRLLDHHGQGTLDLSHGRDPRPRRGRPDARHGLHPRHPRILALLPKQRQNLLFSATFSDEIQNLADGLLNDPGACRGRAAATRPSRPSRSASTRSTASASASCSRHLIGSNDWHQVLVFTRTKHGANRLAEQLDKRRHHRAGDPRQQEPGRAHPGAGRLQGRQPARCWSPPTSPPAASTSTSCRTSSTSTCPTCPRTTSTASAAPAAPAPSGEAISLVCVDEHAFLRDIEKLLKRTLPRDVDRRLRAGPAGAGRADPAAPGPRRGPHAAARRGRWRRRRSARPPASATAHAATHRGGAPATPGRKVVPAGRPAAHAAKAPRPLAKPVARPAPATAPAPRSPLAAQHRPVNRGR